MLPLSKGRVKRIGAMSDDFLGCKGVQWLMHADVGKLVSCASVQVQRIESLSAGSKNGFCLDPLLPA
jgi:hypothetical protein